MSHRIYTPEFEDEAVRQVVERGYAVKEVAERLGISEASLYNWRKAVVPSKDDERAEELLESKRENLTLRAELRRTQEERGILKKAAAYFARESGQGTHSCMHIVASFGYGRCAECSEWHQADSTSGFISRSQSGRRRICMANPVSATL